MESNGDMRIKNQCEREFNKNDKNKNIKQEERIFQIKS